MMIVYASRITAIFVILILFMLLVTRHFGSLTHSSKMNATAGTTCSIRYTFIGFFFSAICDFSKIGEDSTDTLQNKKHPVKYFEKCL
ncbi:unnamed protein product [Gongylonema pulchrum]|uniref:Uncharacterized protein n=1 Tax=Gongylonema pulchrum TaxID=637853 RepID=A0A3P7PMH3_9BILA|nr:unnamed protein product [Gongylonema pulchrum]